MTSTEGSRGDDSKTARGRPADHMANERTHLAWLRTAVSFMTFGITINRFSIFLQQSKLISTEKEFGLWSDSANVGVGLVLIGMLFMLGTGVRYSITSRRIDRGTYRPNGAFVWAITIAVLLLGGLSLTFLFRE